MSIVKSDFFCVILQGAFASQLAEDSSLEALYRIRYPEELCLIKTDNAPNVAGILIYVYVQCVHIYTGSIRTHV